MEKLFFDDTDHLFRILVTAPILYLAVIAFIRFSGKRSSSQMNNFDWIVTVATGSVVGSGIILKDVTITETILAMALLIVFQYFLTRSLLYSKALRKVVKAEPVLLMRQGQFLTEAMARERITESEILAVLRKSGIRTVSDVDAVILENNAALSIIKKADNRNSEIDTMRTVREWTHGSTS